MRKFLVISLVLLALGGVKLQGQINRQYFVWASQDLLMADRYKEAIEMLNILITADPEAHEAYFWRGIAKYNLDDIVGADADFTTTIEKNPVFTMAYQFRAVTRSHLGNYDDALRDYSEAIDLRPDRAGPYFNRGVAYILSGKYQQAIDDFSMYIRLDNHSADAYINRGLAYLQLQDTIRAREDFDSAVLNNREYPRGYAERGALHMKEGDYERALEDFNMAVKLDSTYLAGYFNRAILYNEMNRPAMALADMDKVIELDPYNSLPYFNRAIIRAQIGDYSRALEDYDKVAYYSPGNVIVYYNRGGLYYQTGEFEKALEDYDKAIELYPDFANAYLIRSEIKYLLRDEKGSKRDRKIAEEKIAEYRSKISEDSFSVYADTSRQFNRLLSFDTKLSGSVFRRISAEEGESVSFRPLYRFTYYSETPDHLKTSSRYAQERVDNFVSGLGDGIMLTNRDTNLSPESLLTIDSELSRNTSDYSWEPLFKRGITQSSVRQYTNAVNAYSSAIELDPTNPFLYLNRSVTRAEMIDFISSIDNTYTPVTMENDPSMRLINSTVRTYNYDEAIADLNKAAKLYPEFAHIYYNRANLNALSGNYPEAFRDYSRAIELNPELADAWFNRGLVQIYMKDTRKGLLDISKAGELGIKEAYSILKRYSELNDEL